MERCWRKEPWERGPPSPQHAAKPHSSESPQFPSLSRSPRTGASASLAFFALRIRLPLTYFPTAVGSPTSAATTVSAAGMAFTASAFFSRFSHANGAQSWPK